jgi:hypothetical protein
MTTFTTTTTTTTTATDSAHDLGTVLCILACYNITGVTVFFFLRQINTQVSRITYIHTYIHTHIHTYLTRGRTIL